LISKPIESLPNSSAIFCHRRNQPALNEEFYIQARKTISSYNAHAFYSGLSRHQEPLGKVLSLYQAFKKQFEQWQNLLIAQRWT